MTWSAACCSLRVINLQGVTIAIGSTLVAAMLIGAFLVAMALVVWTLEGGDGARRWARSRSKSGRPARARTDPSRALDPVLPREWWPDFERQFADYVERADKEPF
jgi:hypothetical protein